MVRVVSGESRKYQARAIRVPLSRLRQGYGEASRFRSAGINKDDACPFFPSVTAATAGNPQTRESCPIDNAHTAGLRQRGEKREIRNASFDVGRRGGFGFGRV
ncbi:MAG: hypothetical protein K2X34_13035 [Hyphomonadaceae bacterium]|nr:hypothetical protein [Hyphomonadaceae bacterium]